MNELTITRQAGQVSFDFDAAKKYLEDQLALYNNVVFTEDTKKEAKETVAQLRKDQKAFNEEVKAVKKEYMAPFEEFAAKANELLALYDQPINAINTQITAFEEARKEEKKQLIAAVYAELVPEEELKQIIPLTRIYNHRWENATATEKALRSEIMERKMAAKAALETIRAMKSEKEAEAIERYKQTFDISECILFLNNYEQQKREILAREQERQRQEELERIRNEEREKIRREQEAQKAEAEAQAEREAMQQAAEEDARAREEAARAETIAALTPDDVENVASYGYIIKLSQDGKTKLEMYMDSVGIEYTEMKF